LISRLASFFRLSRRELIALAALFAVSLPAVTARLYSSDEVEYYSYLRSLWFDHDVSFENEYQYFYDHDIAQSQGFHETFLERQTEAGRRINFATMGCALLWMPFYGVADAAVRAGLAGAHVPADGFSRPYVAAVSYASAFYGFLAILLAMRAARIVTGEGVLAGVAVWLGTPLLFYMYVSPPMSHATSAFAVALFVTAWLHARDTWSTPRMALLGLSGALMTMVREQDVFFVAGPVVDFLVGPGSPRPDVQIGRGAARGPDERGWRGAGLRQQLVAAAAGVAAFAIGYLPQLVAYNALNGYPRPSRLVMRKMMWAAPHAGQVLASPAHGFLSWTPLAALAIGGLVALALRGSDPRARRVGVCALVMVALQIYVSGSVESWTVAGAFGQRRFVALTALLVLGLSGLFVTTGAVFSQKVPGTPAGVPATFRGKVAATFWIVVAVCVWWNVALMAQFALRLMDRQRLDLRANAYHAFVTVPRMAPALAYRYFADRSSFYERPQPAQ
jgi:hypothetical protein